MTNIEKEEIGYDGQTVKRPLHHGVRKSKKKKIRSHRVKLGKDCTGAEALWKQSGQTKISDLDLPAVTVDVNLITS